MTHRVGIAWQWSGRQARAWATARRAFTLIELLVVIGIISLLAAMAVGLMQRSSRASRESRTRAELAQLVTAIESYKEAVGSYPPDNPRNPGYSPLFYELSGVIVDNVNKTFRTKEKSAGITADQVKNWFGQEGIANASDDPTRVRRFVELTSKQHAALNPKAVLPEEPVEVLVAPIPWKSVNGGPVAPLPNNPTVTPWRYLGPQSATNNPGSYDLWVEFMDSRELKVIGNWTKDVVVRGKF